MNTPLLEPFTPPTGTCARCGQPLVLLPVGEDYVWVLASRPNSRLECGPVPHEPIEVT